MSFDEASSVFLAERNGLADAAFPEGFHEVLAEGAKGLRNDGLGAGCKVGGNLRGGGNRGETEDEQKGGATHGEEKKGI